MESRKPGRYSARKDLPPLVPPSLPFISNLSLLHCTSSPSYAAKCEIKAQPLADMREKLREEIELQALSCKVHLSSFWEAVRGKANSVKRRERAISRGITYRSRKKNKRYRFSCLFYPSEARDSSTPSGGTAI